MLRLPVHKYVPKCVYTHTHFFLLLVIHICTYIHTSTHIYTQTHTHSVYIFPINPSQYSSFLPIYSLPCCHFLSAQRISFRLSCRECLLAKDSLTFCLFGNVFIPLQFWKDSFPWYTIIKFLFFFLPSGLYLTKNQPIILFFVSLFIRIFVAFKSFHFFIALQLYLRLRVSLLMIILLVLCWAS